ALVEAVAGGYRRPAIRPARRSIVRESSEKHGEPLREGEDRRQGVRQGPVGSGARNERQSRSRDGRQVLHGHSDSARVASDDGAPGCGADASAGAMSKWSRGPRLLTSATETADKGDHW